MVLLYLLKVIDIALAVVEGFGVGIVDIVGLGVGGRLFHVEINVVATDYVFEIGPVQAADSVPRGRAVGVEAYTCLAVLGFVNAGHIGAGKGACQSVETVAVPLQRMLFGGAVAVPACYGDVLARTRKGVGDIDILHIDARLADSHFLGGIVVAVENEAVVLAGVGTFAVDKRLRLVGKEFVLAVGFVPVAHLHLQGVFAVLGLIEHIAIFLVDGEGDALFLRQAFLMPYPRLFHGIARFVEIGLFGIVVHGKHRPSEIADGGFCTFAGYFDCSLSRQREHATGKD